MLLCAPSLGILDNWLPVLHAVRAEHPDWRIVALVPDLQTLAQVDPLDTAHVLADGVIDTTIAPLLGGGWIQVDGFLSAAEVGRPSRAARALLRLTGRLIPLTRLLRTPTQRRAATNLASLSGTGTRLLYDVHLHDKPRIARILEQLPSVPRFSVNHGIELEALRPDRTAPPDPENVRGVHLYGPSEVTAYAQNFRLDPAALHVVGIARHDPVWMEHVVATSERLHLVPVDDFVFMVSRPAGSPYLPRERKVAALRWLHQVAWEEYGLPLVLRTHPKESDDGTLRAALPAEGEGISWALSRAHPFHLARRSRLAVTFFSGVSVDLVASGVPVIELLDVRGIPAFDGPSSPRDDRGRPQFGPYRRDGLVIPADDLEDLRAAFCRIAEDRPGTVRDLMTAYRAAFAAPDRAIARIVADLEVDPGPPEKPGLGDLSA